MFGLRCLGAARRLATPDLLVGVFSGADGEVRQVPAADLAALVAGAAGGSCGDILAKSLLTHALFWRQERNSDGKRRLGLPRAATHFATPDLPPQCVLRGLRPIR